MSDTRNKEQDKALKPTGCGRCGDYEIWQYPGYYVAQDVSGHTNNYFQDLTVEGLKAQIAAYVPPLPNPRVVYDAKLQKWIKQYWDPATKKWGDKPKKSK